LDSVPVALHSGNSGARSDDCLPGSCEFGINAENAADCNLWRLGADCPAQVPFALTPGSMFPLAVFAVRSCGLWLWLVRAKRFGHGGPI